MREDWSLGLLSAGGSKTVHPVALELAGYQMDPRREKPVAVLQLPLATSWTSWDRACLAAVRYHSDSRVCLYWKTYSESEVAAKEKILGEEGTIGHVAPEEPY
jgi:hypothetical protein